MNIIYVLIPVSLLLVGLAIWAFFWAVGTGQYDDLDTPALRVLSDDEPAQHDEQDEHDEYDPR